MTHHAHRRPHRYAPPRVTAWSALAAAGAVSLAAGVILLVTADDAGAAPRVPAVRVYQQGASGAMHDADWEAYSDALVYQMAAAVGQAATRDALLVAP